LSGHGYLIGLLVDQSAAQVILTRYADGGQNQGATAVLGFLAIQYDQLLFGCRTTHLLLDGQNGFLHLTASTRWSRRQKVGCVGTGYLPWRLRRIPRARRWAWLKPRANLAISFCPRGAPQRVAKKRIVNIDHSG